MKELTLIDRGITFADFISISEEDKRQIVKWDYQTHSVFEWLAFLLEEAGELSEAISEYIYRTGSKNSIANEAIQVATLALKIAVMAKEAKL